MNNPIPAGWIEVSLEEAIISKTLGTTLRGSEDDELLLVKMGNLLDGEIVFNKTEFVQCSDDLEQLTLKYGDFLLNTRNTPELVGKVATFRKQNVRAVFDNNLMRLQFKDGIDSIYMGYLFNLEITKSKIKALVSGTTSVAALYWKDLCKLPIVIPAYTEQQKIVAMLTSVDEVIERTQAQIDKLKALKAGMMQELLSPTPENYRTGDGNTEFKDSPLGRIPEGWEVANIGSLGAVVTGSTPKTSQPENYGGAIPFISPADIGDHMRINHTKSALTESGIQQTRKIPADAVCVVCIGSTIGKTGLTTEPSATNQQINSIICKDSDPNYVYYLMTLNANLIKSEASTQAVPIINKSAFSNLLVKVAPLVEQKIIGTAISTVDRQLSAMTDKLTAIRYTKSALMQDLLTGKVRVTVDSEN